MNEMIIKALSEIKQTDWNGNTIHPNLDFCLRAINLQSNNSGWYNPIAIKIPKLTGYYMINEDKSIFFEARIIKEDDNKFRIEYMSMSAYNDFEKKYSDYINV